MENQNDATEMEKRAKKAVIAFGMVNNLQIDSSSAVGSSIPGFALPEEDGTLYKLSGRSGVSRDGETPITNFVLEVSRNGADFEPMSQGIDIDVCLQRYEKQLEMEAGVSAGPTR